MSTRQLIHRMVIDDLEDDRLELQWRGPSGGISVVIPEDDSRVLAWKLNCDGDPIGDPVLFVGAQRVGHLP